MFLLRVEFPGRLETLDCLNGRLGLEPPQWKRRLFAEHRRSSQMTHFQGVHGNAATCMKECHDGFSTDMIYILHIFYINIIYLYLISTGAVFSVFNLQLCIWTFSPNLIAIFFPILQQKSKKGIPRVATNSWRFVNPVGSHRCSEPWPWRTWHFRKMMKNGWDKKCQAQECLRWSEGLWWIC